MTSLPVEEPPSKTVVRLRIKYIRTTIVLNILLTSVFIKKVMHCLVVVAFFGTPCMQYVRKCTCMNASLICINRFE